MSKRRKIATSPDSAPIVRSRFLHRQITRSVCPEKEASRLAITAAREALDEANLLTHSEKHEFKLLLNELTRHKYQATTAGTALLIRDLAIAHTFVMAPML